MGIRTNVEVSLAVGHDNDLANVAFECDMQQLLDTLEREESGSFTLDAGESNYAVPFGDVAQSRMVYIEADGPIRITPGGGTATGAITDGVAGVYPTTFDGSGDTLDIEIDGTEINVEFLAADQSLAQVINRINAAAALLGITGVGGVPVTVARDSGGGQLRLLSPTTGESSSVEVLDTTAAGVLTALGLTAAEEVGENASPGQTPITLYKPADTTSSDDAAGVKVYLLATLVTTALTIDNLDDENAVIVKCLIAGDLTTTPPCEC